MENTQELIQKFKEELIENIRKEISETGGISTYLQLMGKKKDEEKPVIIHIETDFTDEDDKKFFMDEGIPAICTKLKKHEISPLCVCFVAEAWMRVLDKNINEEKKTEVVIVNVSTEKGDDMIVYNIIRHPYEVDEKGELTSKTELSEEEMSKEDGKTPSSGGRFSNLYQKFAKGLCN